uniref:Mitochondrial sodium/hydrogen exchanger 9B2 n=2 Tax=Ceratitis capitata TaxID=7213 RepID=W8B8J4_CERCA
MASNSRSTKSQAALLTEGDEAEMPLAQFKSTEEKLQQLRTLMGDAKEGIRDDETAHLLINNQRPQVKLRVAKVQSQENQKCKQISKEKQQDECIESEQELSTAYFGHFGEDGGGNGVKNNTMNCEGGIIGGKAAAAHSTSPGKMTQHDHTATTIADQTLPDYSEQKHTPTPPAALNTTTDIEIGVGGNDDGPHGHGAELHQDYKGPKIWRILVKHWPYISQPLALAAVFIALWVLGYVLLPDYALPNTPIMRIFFLFVGAQLTGVLVTFIALPDMLGMLFFGVLYTNAGLADFTGYNKFEAFLREMALINIMLLAGLGLDASAFKKLWFMILRLTLVPTIAEVTIIAMIARFTLDMPWFWGILLGLVVTAVSPNVVVTVMLKLKEERLGLNSGIHTLIYAMTSCNDVVAIFLFGVILSVIFSTDKSLTQQILQGPIGIGIGIVFGYVYGLMLTILPSTKTAYLNGLRFVLTVLGGTISVMGSRTIGYPSAGALGCMTIAFFAGIGWKGQQQHLTPQQLQRQLENENSSVPARLDLLWKFLKPVSFSLIGKEINFDVLDGRVVGYGALLVLLGSLFRLTFAYLSTYGGNLTRKERAYITISCFPKATVQAALGPLALDMARSLKGVDEQSINLASNVLIISVLAIIFTAPLGAVLMLRLAPLWLQRSDVHGEGNGNSNSRDCDVNEFVSSKSNNTDSPDDTLKISKKIAQSLSQAGSKTQNNGSSNSLKGAVDVYTVDGDGDGNGDAGQVSRTQSPWAKEDERKASRH